jgi:AraC-like DNA-binding protein
VAAYACEYAAGFVDPAHQHPRAQLLYGCTGVMTVLTSQGEFVVPPHRAMWLPAGTSHEVACRLPVSLRTLFVDAAAAPALPGKCCVIEVSRLLHSLLNEAVQLPEEYEVEGRDGRIMNLAIDEIVAMRALPYSAPLPDDPRLARICRVIIDGPATEMSLDELASAAGMTRHTLTRHFQRETGMTFVAWRQHVRMLEALWRLHTGQSVTSVAYDIGYKNPSSFAAMFRRAFGTRPSDYYN